MRLVSVEIRNFRLFVDFRLDLNGDSVSVVAPNGGGKTSLLRAIASALTGQRITEKGDFRDVTRPIELIATLDQLSPSDQAAFVDAVEFGGGAARLRIGVRAVWDDVSGEVDSLWGFPGLDWQRVGRSARGAVKIMWLPADRDPARLVAFARPRSLMDDVLATLPLDLALNAAIASIETALNDVVADPAMAGLLGGLDTQLTALVPDAYAGAFDVDTAVQSPRDLLAQFQLAMSYLGPHAAVAKQSSGLAQLAAFIVGLQLLDGDTILLVDEPEMSLHPQAQRSVLRALLAKAGQGIIATHSSSLISSVTPRDVVRLKRGSADVEPRRAVTLTPDDSTKLQRYATAETAEAFFASTVLFVEGASDLLALRVIARTIGVDLDARGVAVISLDGAGLLSTYLRLLGPQGLDIAVSGLCDLDAEADWIAKLAGAGLTVTDRASFNTAGFFVCDLDLEAELVRAVGAHQVEAVINAEGASHQLAAFCALPGNTGLSRDDQLAGFLRKAKTRWAPLVSALVTSTNVPSPIHDLLTHV
ncbi:AAA family ATPase [Conexibacter sp. W3-3-2]|uniref:ATP-dependent nuclease n=1 Tax=Conexibacter sp. W3-3-2 TaxID=2675227 RepID=UPI0012B7024A|nr:AAA family ATPase [Conexibacter sp. W3-3-2]MTD43641.1 AAA family ATPase [Conexibacter sp. W3-3-2]